MPVTIGRTAWTDDDGSGTTGTVINNAAKTSLYDQIDTALAAVVPLAGATMTGDLKFTDATYDIGKSGATRPRDGFFSRNVVIGGTAGVTGVATFTAQPVVSSLTASQAVFTDGSKGLVSNAITGTGNVVMSASPTLTGTVAVVGLTASGVIQQNAAAGTAGLVINANAGGSVAARVEHAKSGTVEWMTGYGAYSGGSDYEVATFTTSAGVKMGLTTGGVMTITNLASGSLTSASGVITSSSDERMKTILGPLPYGLPEVLQLEPIVYRWNEHSGIPLDADQGGFGAAQVEQSMPLAVAYGPDGMRSLSDRPILGALVNAIKELERRLAILEGRASGVPR